MRKLCLFAVLVAAIAGCPTTDELFLTQPEIEALQVNFEAAVDAEQQLAEVVFSAARGDIDLAVEYPGANYDPPTLANGMVGTLTIPGGVFSFGTGDLSVVFTTTADGVAVDPFLLDLTTVGQLLIDADVTFDGISLTGAPLQATADVTLDTIQNGVDTVQTVIDGYIRVIHDGYDVELSPNNVELTLDLLLDRVTNVTGNIAGSVDIPDFVIDADFDVDGLGDRIEIGIDAAATTIRYTLSIFDL